MLPQKVQTLAANFYSDLLSIRHHLHSHPELSFKEHNTCKYIAQQLDQYGIPYTAGIGGTGVVAMIEGRNPRRKVIALRADIDALPICEANKVDYASQNTGVMHACGHDVHTTCLLGAARILNELRHEWEGSIKLIFQPAEEVIPSGAPVMIAEGVLENPAPVSIFGQHADPMMPLGTIGLCGGMAMASADEIRITIHGKGGHAARPHQCIDTVLVAAHVVVALQQLVSRMANPLTPSVLTFGKISTDGGATNVIPNQVHLLGTFRTFDEEWRKVAHQKIQHLTATLCESMGARAEVSIPEGLPHVKNDASLIEMVRQAATLYLGADKVLTIPPRMGAEDFGFYSHRLPACFYRLGVQNPNGTDLHTPTFDINEKSLEIGAGLMAWIALAGLV